MCKEINLRGRNPYCIKKFIQVKDNLYAVFTKFRDSDVYAPIRIIGEKDNIEAIDFDGGPFLSVGSKLEDYTTEEFKDFEIKSFFMVKNVGTFVEFK